MAEGDSDVKLDRLLRGSAPIGRRIESGRPTLDTDTETEPMAPTLRQANAHDLERDRLREENRRRDRRLATLEAAIIGTDIKPGVHAMVAALKNDISMLRQDVKDERRDRHDDARVNSIAMWVMAAGMIIASVALLVIAAMRAMG
jgi:hypothetical protein